LYTQIVTEWLLFPAKVEVYFRIEAEPMDAKLSTTLQSLEPLLALFAAHFEDGAVVAEVTRLLEKAPDTFVNTMLKTLTGGRVRLLSEMELATVPPLYLLAYLCYCTLWFSSLAILFSTEYAL
jgi:hypothetical protein